MPHRPQPSPGEDFAAVSAIPGGTVGDVDFYVPLVVTLAGFGAVVGGLAWIGLRARRRGVGGSVLGAVDEIFHPAAYQPRIEIQQQTQRKVNAPAPGDPPTRAGIPPQ
jgi:hypothetical protein